MSDLVSTHYDGGYFDWQSSIGEFGGWANQSKFAQHISRDQVVLDFGCGGGFLLKNLDCRKKIGVEVNPTAADSARKKGIEVFSSVAEVPDQSVDVIISNHALEHALQPLSELKGLLTKLKPGGKAIFVVPSESISCSYRKDDINHHLFTWSPMCLGNLFSEAGFSVIESRPYTHKWPPKYKLIARIGGRGLFDFASRLYARLDRRSSQVKLIAERPKN